MTGTEKSLAIRLQKGDVILGSWHQVANPELVSAACVAGMGCIFLDVQHGYFELDSVCEAKARAALADIPIAVRIAAHDYAAAPRYVDAGADAIVAPMIENADDAATLVKAIKYPPLGLRSWGPTGAMRYFDGDADSYLQNANDHVLALAMIETRSAVDNLEAIIAVEGLDGVLVGPSDLSIALSNGEERHQFGPRSMPIIERIGSLTRSTGKIAAVFTTEASDAQKMRELGYNLISVTTDLMALDAGLRKALSAIGNG